MKTLMWIDRQIEKIAKVSMWIAVGCLFVMVFLISIEVVGRYFLKYSTLIADEYGAYLFVGCSFLGFAYSFRKGNFLRVSIVISRLRPQYYRYFHFGASIIGFVFSLIITYEVAKLTYISFLYHSKSIQPSATPLFIPQLILPIGMAFMTIVFLYEAIMTLTQRTVPPDGDSGKEVG